MHRTRRPCFGHAHYLSRDMISFLLVLIIGSAYGQFALKANNLALPCEALSLNQLRDAPVAQGSLQLENGRRGCPLD